MGISKIAWDKKVEAVEKYKRGEGSKESIAREYGIRDLQWMHLPESLSSRR